MCYYLFKYRNINEVKTKNLILFLKNRKILILYPIILHLLSLSNKIISHSL